MRRRLPWLLAVILTALGSLGAHGFGALPAEGPSEPHVHAMARELAGRSGSGVFAVAVIPMGILVAVALVAVVGRLAARSPRARGALIAGFFFLPPVAFVSQELAERLLRAEAFGFDAALEPRLVIGIVLQLPAAVAALAVAWLLLRVVRRIAGALRGEVARRLPSAAPAPAWSTIWTPLPIAPLALGYPERGPPRPRSLRA